MHPHLHFDLWVRRETGVVALGMAVAKEREAAVNDLLFKLCNVYAREKGREREPGPSVLRLLNAAEMCVLLLQVKLMASCLKWPGSCWEGECGW